MKKTRILSRRDFLYGVCALGASVSFAGLSMGLASSVEASPLNGTLGTEQQTRLLMGTVVTLTAVTGDRSRAEEAFEAAFAEMERLILVFDRRDPSSALSVLNSEGGLSSAPPELCAVLSESGRLGQATNHVFNPAIVPVLDFVAKARSNGHSVRFDDAGFAQALALAEPSGIRVEKDLVRLERQGMRLTLDGIAKGYIADAASQALSRHGISNHMVNAGGDIRTQGLAANGRPWTIGVQHPARKGALLTSLTLGSGGVATSGLYEQPRGKDAVHLVSPLTGKSSEFASVTVKARTAMQADALATALSVMPPSLAVAHVEKHGASACYIVDRVGRVFASSNWG